MNRAVVFLSGFWLLFCAGEVPKNKFVKVYFPDGFSVTAELAVTDEQRAQGLMFREKLAEDQGMLFIFEEKERHSFWMKNMRFPIDILWLDAQRKIVHLEPRVPPCHAEPCPTYRPDAAAAYVLELQSGFAEKHNLRPYSRLEFILPKDLSVPRNRRP
ncbi:MAG: DUF192 domain-containing protein [Acidobacteriota bacterium]